MDIKDLAGLSEPLKKLIKVIGKGCGAVSKPFLTRANTAADVDKIKKISQALDDANPGATIEFGYKGGELSVHSKPLTRQQNCRADCQKLRLGTFNLRLYFTPDPAKPAAPLSSVFNITPVIGS